MKAALALVLLLCVAACPGATPSPLKPQRLSLFGKEYVRLDQWARANSCQWKWVSKNEALIWNSNIRMQFTTSSRRMTLNGINILLSESVLNQNGVPHLALIDLTTAIQPVIYPPRNRPRAQVKHICLDPGHGGKDPGNREGREEEKKYTLLLAQELATQLRAAGFTVSLTRTGDTYPELGERPEIARRRGADLFLSLHFNSPGSGGSDTHGAEVYCLTPQRASSTNSRGEGGNSGPSVGNLNNARNMLLAYELQKALVRGAGLEDRGVKRARFAVLTAAEMPAVLIEGGFMTNPAEGRKIYSATWRRYLAQSIVNGVQSYRKIVEP